MFEPDGSIILDKDFVNPYEDGAAAEAIQAYNARGYNPNRDPETGQFTFGSGGEDGGSLGTDMTQVDTSYRGSHGAPNRDDGVSSPGHDLTNTFPSDIYSSDAARRYPSGYDAIDKEAIQIIHSVHNKPNAKVMIYRAVPNKASIEVINPGDWVAITKGYADYHGESNLNNEYKVLIKEVRAKDIWNNADSIQEWGYDPTVDKNYLDDLVTNGPGYNPNRDDKTGRFTFGNGGEKTLEVGFFSGRHIHDALGGVDPEDFYRGNREVYVEEHIGGPPNEDGFAVKKYAGSSNHQFINEYLRYGTISLPATEYDGQGEFWSANGTLEETVARHSKEVIATTSFETVIKPMTAYRGASFHKDKISQMKPGAVIQDKGIMSTSLNGYRAADYAERWATDEKLPVVFRINFRPGQKGIYADGYARHEETEWIPQYGTELKILNTTKLISSETKETVGIMVDTEAIQ